MKTWRYVGILAFLVIGLTTNAGYAGPPSGTQERSWLRTTGNGVKAPVRATGLSVGQWAALILVVGLGGFAVWKRRVVSGRLPQANVSTLRICAVTRLSPKAQIVAVEVQGRTLLLGATDTNITRLGWLDDETEKDDDELDEDEEVANSAPPPARTTLPRATRVQMRVRSECGAPLPNEKKAQVDASSRKPSRFRELLADAIGLTPRSATQNLPVLSAPVDELAAVAADRYVGRDAQSIHTQRMRRESTHTAALIDVEGQAKGLVARLNRPPT